jgi:hypothetical protein
MGRDEAFRVERGVFNGLDKLLNSLDESTYVFSVPIRQ